jgi:DNA-binding NarL/FixJ family response regulator
LAGAVRELTPAEEAIVELLIDGYPVPAIAQLTGGTTSATEASVRVVLAKVGAADRADLRRRRDRGEV